MISDNPTYLPTDEWLDEVWIEFMGWLKEERIKSKLERNIKTFAHRNPNVAIKTMLDLFRVSLHPASWIGSAFDWSSAPEGSSFWAEKSRLWSSHFRRAAAGHNPY